jgi:hypothetical protein
MINKYFLKIIICSLGISSTLLAHNPDTSYTQIKISGDELESKFTFDLATLLKIADLDRNDDHQVTLAELEHQSGFISDWLSSHVTVSVDGRHADFGKVSDLSFVDKLNTTPERDYAVTLVQVAYKKEFSFLPEHILLKYDFFNEFGSQHSVLTSINEPGYEAETIIFNQDQPDYLYFTNTPRSLTKQTFEFLKLGVKHIFFGYDHILFLLALLVVANFWELVKIVTSFTVAHSITLVLSALELVRLPTRLIETGIAVTIIYVALENFWLKKSDHRWKFTFLFGLIHGFGFANVLRDLGLPSSGLITSLVSFNIGLEAGQICVVLALLPLSIWIGQQSFRRQFNYGVSTIIATLGFAWFVERAFALNFMPF